MLSTIGTKSNSNITFSSSHNYQQSPEVTGNLDDLLTEILLCIPIKLLLKFKSVSKHWLSLISNPVFCHRLSLIRKPITGLFYHHFALQVSNPEYDFINLDSNPSSPPFRTLTFVNTSYGNQILQSCNGLLLCSSGHSNYYFYDPTTKGVSRSIFGVNLAFDPSKSSDHKVIYVGACDSFLGGQLHMEIYSSETSDWRYGEKLQEMPMPPVPDGWDSGIYQYFGESGGHLLLIDFCGASPFIVYEMRTDYSGWFVKHHVDLGGVAAAFPEMIRTYLDPDDLHYYGYSLLGVVGEENDDDSYLLLHLPNKVVHYDLKDKTYKNLLDVASDGNQAADASSLQYRWFGAFQYYQCLACV
ncbi:hypothetical protein CUMW_200760 [Citrus unshiu]|uniref:F-box domain-containing protein n=2 Tax=Citrus TaxID=2706 RepID=A0A067D7H5_CITSI|nr:hypothetical protein CISIN_1g018504mg [Citrus sinensis]GAY60284.1 hypothetical protein CUMW_200760 [Citrus unshiu]